MLPCCFVQICAILMVSGVQHSGVRIARIRQLNVLPKPNSIYEYDRFIVWSFPLYAV